MLAERGKFIDDPICLQLGPGWPSEGARHSRFFIGTGTGSDTAAVMSTRLQVPSA